MAYTGGDWAGGPEQSMNIVLKEKHSATPSPINGKLHKKPEKNKTSTNFPVPPYAQVKYWGKAGQLVD